MIKLLNYTQKGLKEILTQNNEPSFRASQFFNWIYKKFVFELSAMTDLPAAQRPVMAEKYQIIPLTQKDQVESSEHETIKFLFETKDGKYIEAVLIAAPEDDPEGEDNSPGERLTLCVSSQAGCPLGCKFCATGLLGFERNLEAEEIISQVLLAEKYISESRKISKGNNSAKLSRNISNIVFMGMGEPLLNYEAVLKSVEILNSSAGYNLGSRHFTISTAGLTPEIGRLSAETLQIRLAISLHAASQTLREQLMPVAKKYPLPELISSIKEYQKDAARRVTFEYILIAGLNDSPSDAVQLKQLLEGLDYNLNLIAYNPVEGLPYQTPSEKDAQNFMSQLKKLNIPFVFRRSKGNGIQAGCGQLGLYWKEKTL